MKCEKCGKEIRSSTQLIGHGVRDAESADVHTGRIEAYCVWCLDCCLKAIDEAGKPKPPKQKMSRADAALRGLVTDYKLDFYRLDDDAVPLARWVESESGYGAVLEVNAARAMRLLKFLAQQFTEWIRAGLEEVEA